MMRDGLLSRSATHHVSVYLGGYVDMRIACKLGGVYTQVRPVSLMPSTVPPLGSYDRSVGADTQKSGTYMSCISG